MSHNVTTVPTGEKDSDEDTATPMGEMGTDKDTATSPRGTDATTAGNKDGTAGCGERPAVLGWLQARRQDWQQQDLKKKYNCMKYCTCVLALVVVVLLISATVPSSCHANHQCALTQQPANTQPSTCTQPPTDTQPPTSTEPPVSTQPPTSTEPPASTQPLSLEEQYKQEQQKARCHLTMIPVDVTVQVKKLLSANDEIRDRLLPLTALAMRCRGLCDDGGSCLFRQVDARDVVVQYRADNGTIMYTKRKIQDHTDCMCEPP